MSTLLEITFKDFLFNVLCNLVASILFIMILYFLFAPRLKMSDFIVCTSDYGGEKSYIFKIVNLSSFSLFDLKTSLSYRQVIPREEEGKYNTSIFYIPIVISEIKTIKAYRPFKGRKTADYALLIRTTSDLENILKISSFSLELIIDATHPVSLSGTSRKIFSKIYTGVNCIKHAHGFKHGKNLQVA